MKKKVVLSKATIIKEINNRMAFELTTINEINTRGYITLCLQGQRFYKYCFDAYGRFEKNGKYYSNKELFNYLLSKGYIEY